MRNLQRVIGGKNYQRTFYCAFQKIANSEVQKPADGHRLRFVIGAISIRFVCFCVSRFVACDRDYDSMTAAKNAIVKAAFEL